MPRPTKYKEEYANIAKKMCELGATDADIAQALGIVLSTFYLWKHEHPEFSDSLKVGKQSVDDRVEMSLYRKAVGYKKQSVKVFNNQGEEMIVEYDEDVEPDTTAAIFWLKNRRPDKWRAQPESFEADSKLTINIVDAQKKKDAD